MTRDDSVTIRFPIRLLTVNLLLTIVVFAWSGWIVFEARRDVQVFTDRVSRIEQLRGAIIYLDEVQTMSARMAAETGNLRWEEKYRQFEPQLAAAIEETTSLTNDPTAIEAATRTGDANLKLVEMENHAFALIRDNHKQEAQQVLFGPEYEAQEKLYAAGEASFINRIRREFDDNLRHAQRVDLLLTIAVLVVGGISFLAWFRAVRGVRRWRLTLEQSFGERARSAGALRESEERYRELFENAKDAIYVHDLKGTYLSANRAAEKLSGYSLDEILGGNFADFLAPEFGAEIRDKLAQKLAEHGETTYEVELITKDGRRVPVEVSSRLIHEQGIAVGVQGMVRDITERKRAEAERQAITEIVQGVMTTSNLDELFTLAHETISKLLPAENCYVALYDKTSDLLHVPFCKDEFDTVASSQRLGRGLTAFVLRRGRPMLLTPELIRELVSSGEIELVGTLPAAWLGVPLRTSSDIIGVLVVQHYEDEDAYSQQDLELLASVGDQLGLAIERKRIEIKLKTNEMQLTAAQQIAHVGSWEWDNVNRKLHWSEELFRILGLPPEGLAITFKDCFRYVHPDDRKLVMSSIKQVLRGGEFPEFDYRVIRPDGTVRTLQVNSKAIADATGRVTKMWGTTQDITERKRIEIELKTNAMRLNDAQHIANLGNWEWDLITNNVHWSTELYRIFGLPPETQGSTFGKFLAYVHPDDRNLMARTIEQTLQNKVFPDCDYRIVRPDGMVRTLQCRAEVIVDETGRVGSMWGTLQDVTERKHAEKAMSDLRRELELTMASMEEGVLRVDLKGDIVFENLAAARMLGAEVAELLGKSAHLTMHHTRQDGTPYPKEECPIHATIRDGLTRQVTDEVFWRRDGTSFPVEYMTAPMRNDHHEIVAAVVTFRDITERKRAETERDVISEVVQSVNLTANLGELLKQVHQSLKKVLYAENCCVALFDKQSGLFESPLFVDLVEPNPFPVALSNNCTAKVFSSGQPLLMNETIFAELLDRGEVELIGRPAPSFLAVPLMTPAETIGVIVVQHYERENVYSQRDVEFLSAVAAQLALAIERKRTEAALIESERRFRDLFYDAPVGYHELDIEGRITCVNTTELLMLGYSSEEMIGHHVWEFIEDAEIARRIFAEKMAGSKPLRHVERSFRRKDGTFMAVQLDDQMLIDPSGKLIGIRATLQDIVERKQIENTLRQERIFLRTLLDHLPDSVYVKDMACRKVIANLAEVRISGLHSEVEILGKDDFEVYPKELADKFFADDQVVLQTGQPVVNREEYVPGEQGQKTWLLTTKIPLRDENGQIVGLIGLGRDITERKRIEAELKKNEELMSEAQRIAHLGSWEHDAASGEVNWSLEEWQIFGLDQRECGPSFEEFLALVHPDDRHIVKTIAERSQQSKTIISYDYRIIRPDGTVRVLRANGNIVIDELGQVVKITGTDQDITEQKQIEDDLIQSEQRFRDLFENASDVIYTADFAGNFTSLNQSGERMTGYSREEALHLNFSQIVSPETLKLVQEMTRRKLESNEETVYELEFLKKDGEPLLIEVSSRAIYENGKPVGIQGIGRDITQRKQVEAELKEARDAALESVRLKSEFLANMSHEIRTPMNGVIGMTGLLLETELTSPQREYTETIESSAEALLTIINDILDFSKIESGLLRFETIDFELRAAVESTVDQIAERAQAKGLELASLVYRDVPTALRGDPGRLRQVLTNLIGNAVKFTERGEVVVSVMKVSETASAAMLRFEIQDTGIGISAEAQRGLFRAFIQADGSTTRKYGGTGLGLAISKQLVELMGGEIGIESAPGAGSIFWFTAKLEKQLTAAPLELEAVGKLTGARMLIVDDNAANRKILKHQTSSWKMIATEADSGKQALELLHAGVIRGEPYDVAILDLMMPEMSGFQLAEAIKADPSIASVALVLLPSFGMAGDGERARQLGIAAYLQKPVRQAKLHDCLTKVMAGSYCSEPNAPGSLVTRHSLREAEVLQKDRTSAGVRVIIAEDNPINQRVAVEQLRNLGYHAAAVTNGQELLKALEQDAFDLILMDCQMPEMDGFAATAEIRRREGGVRHTTIIAMTANALDGDEEKCLAAGMDDYLSKPVKVDVLRRKLEHWIGAKVRSNSLASDEYPKRTDRGGSSAAVPAANPRGNVIDRSQLAALRVIQQPGQADLVTELIDLFVAASVTQLKALHEAISSNNAVEIQRVSHFMNGSAANIGARQMAALFGKLERKAPAKDASELMAELESEFALVREALSAERIDTAV